MAFVGTSMASPVTAINEVVDITGEAFQENEACQVEKAAPEPEHVVFDPSKHLAFVPPSQVHTMNELGYPNNRGVSPVGVSEPFSLFSVEAVEHMRKEVLTSEVYAKHKYSSEIAECQLRGYAAECAPFVYDAWKNPETLAIISKVAGVDLVPVMDFELGHVNISGHNEEEKHEAVKEAGVLGKGIAVKPSNDDAIVDWHTDSYPFVCVTMLSDCTNMIGGETALRTGNGDIVKVRGPQKGSAVILQGRYIEHKALRALGATERITMVTSFRPRASSIKDDTVLTTVRPISDLNELYHQFTEYRFEILGDRLRDVNKLMRDQKRARRTFDTRAAKLFIREQIDFLEHMNKEIVDDEKVIKGVIDDSHLVSEDLKLERSRKRALADVE
ncbi:hypothetical protein CBS76997_3510 [Aspergillus niger]|uniref:Peptidase M16 inactive domain family protein n=1 Tax=Aspergillus niger TaxID=5061 RepID=A0A254U230_ASPNG|nr:hypothetical protein CBS13152_3121 [Aspergillus niger]KAI2972251.1 hypothetical protein CBS147323_2505 [Aspergillus niger]KAI3030623.1 hypothetical protein CBS147347_2646 [Aspergillus niger]KAI3033370.1 hypothetical protein CBS147345_934 [Aspergillus niger]KAI3047407.1 hypothetical protein CBS76997_3510 [Aspergillus niger]